MAYFNLINGLFWGHTSNSKFQFIDVFLSSQKIRHKTGDILRHEDSTAYRLKVVVFS